MAGVLSTHRGDTCQSLVRLLFDRFQIRLAKEFGKSYDTLLNNAVTDVDYKKFASLFNVQNWSKAPKVAAETVYKIKQNVDDTEKAKKIQAILINAEFNPEVTEKEIAKGLLEICTSYELQFFEVLIDNEGRIEISKVELMAAALVEIILNHLRRTECATLSCQEIINAAINYEFDQSLKEKTKNAVKTVASNISNVSPAAVAELAVTFRNEIKNSAASESLVDPKKLICRPLIVNKDDLNGRGELKYFEDSNFYVPPNCKEIKLDKYGFRLNFPSENLSEYEIVCDKDKVKHLTNFKYKSCHFHLAKLIGSDKDELINKMCNLSIEDNGNMGEEEKKEDVLEYLKKMKEEILNNKTETKYEVASTGPVTYKIKKMVNDGERFDEVDTVKKSQKGNAPQEMINTNSSYNKVKEVIISQED